MREFCVYGNPTVDIIRVSESETFVAYGGGSYYSSLPLLEAGERVRVYAVYSPLLINHPVLGLLVPAQYSTRTNVFVLEYTTGGRRLRVVDKAPPIYPWNHHEDPCYTVVNPVLGEVGLNLLRKLAENSMMLALDLQGFLREVRGEYIEVRSSTEALEALSMANVVHMDFEELVALTNASDVYRAMYSLSKLLKGVAVVTVRPRKTIIVTREWIREVEYEYAPAVINRTGSGDYYLSSYFYNYIKVGDEVESAHRAHELTTRWLLERERLRARRDLSTLEQPRETLHQK